MKQPDWKLLARIALSVITFGWAWIADNQIIIIAFAASVIVWIISYFVDRQVEIGKTVKTIFLFAVAVILQLIFIPVTFPPFDVSDFPGYLSALLETIGAIFAGATIVYNLLLAEVLKQLPDGVSWVLRRPVA